MKFKISLLVFGILLIYGFTFVSAEAGVGISAGSQAIVVNQGSENCVSYGIYNPYPDDSLVQVSVSENLQDYFVSEIDELLVPGDTLNSDAIPVELCFEAPKGVYDDCGEELESYLGEVIATQRGAPVDGGGSGGSAAVLSQSSRLNLTIGCEESSGNLTLLYIIIALVALAVIIVILFMKLRRGSNEVGVGKGINNNNSSSKNAK